MAESKSFARTVIPEHLMLIRLAQSEQMREFFIQVWIQNPKLAKQGGIKVHNLLLPLMDTTSSITGSASTGSTGEKMTRNKK